MNEYKNLHKFYLFKNIFPYETKNTNFIVLRINYKVFTNI